jgi:hypothetical protein
VSTRGCFLAIGAQSYIGVRLLSRRLALTIYNLLVPSTPLSADTSADIERMQIEAWRRMSVADKAAIISGLTEAAYALARAGVRARHPGAPPREQFLRLAVVTLGRDLAREVYPDVATLDLR